MKLYIIGAAGSGKTTLARRISERLKIVSVNLDDLFWINSPNGYGNRRTEGERNAMLDAVLQGDSWIIEGTYVEWPLRAMKEADSIIYLKTPKLRINFRIWKRFLRRKLGLEQQTKKETFRGVRELVTWNSGQITAIDALMTRMNNEKHIDIVKGARDIRRLEERVLASQS